MGESKVTLKAIDTSTGSSNGAYKWVVYYPHDTPGKARRIKRFKLKVDATAFRDLKEVELLNAGRDGGSLTAKASREAAWAQKALKPYGIGIQDVVKDYIARKKRDDRSITVINAVDECIDHKRKNGASGLHLQTLTHKLSSFTKKFGKRLVSDITTKEINQWLHSLTHAPVTRRGYRAVVVGLFSWAEKQGYCESNPASRTDLPKLKKNREPDIFTPEQLRVLLNNTPSELIPVIAVQAFAGLRPGEADSLDWADIDRLGKTISVDPIGKKGASHRIIPISPTLLTWLKPFTETNGPITPSNYLVKTRAFKSFLRGHQDTPFPILKAERDKEGPTPKLKKGGKRPIPKLRKDGVPSINWTQHILRHSYASYAMAEKQDSAAVSFLLGHSDKDTLFSHYRTRVTKAEAKQWFSTKPEKGRKIISIMEAV